MNFKRLLPAFLFLFVTILAVCCKKKSNSNPFGNSRIATVTKSFQGSVTVYRIVYNINNQVDSIVTTGTGTSGGSYGYTVFDYSYNSYSITDQSGNSYTVNTDANGNIIKMLVQDTLVLTYSGSELAALQQYIPANNTYTTTDFVWQSGNVVRDSAAGSAAVTYNYNTSQPGQPGDAWRIEQFLTYGQSYVKTNNLLTEEEYNGNWLGKYFYVTDGSGRITQYTLVANNNGYASNDTIVYNYTYYN